MSKPYSVLLKEIQLLQAHADAVRERELVGVLASIREAMKAYSITIAELCDPVIDVEGGIGMRPVKYRDGENNVWGGRGPRPRWLRDALKNGRTLKDFEV